MVKVEIETHETDGPSYAIAVFKFLDGKTIEIQVSERGMFVNEAIIEIFTNSEYQVWRGTRHGGKELKTDA
jgi:hypothetical protein